MLGRQTVAQPHRQIQRLLVVHRFKCSLHAYQYIILDGRANASPRQAASPQYLATLQAANVQMSLDGKGRALDNIFTERLWRTVKYEEVYLHDYLSPREARQALTRYFTFYNQERLHQALDYQTPAEVYFHQASMKSIEINE